MQKLSTANLKPGMISAQNVYRADGELLVATGSPLDEFLIRQIKEWGLGSLGVAHPLFVNAEPPDILPEEIRVRAIRTVREVYSRLTMISDVDITSLVELSRELTQLVRDKENRMVHWGDLRTFDDYVYGHSVNVCLLSLIVGLQRNLDENQLQDLALGALLHDLGLVKIPAEIMNKAGKLSTDEIRISRKHTEIAFEMLTETPSVNSAIVAQIALQHHENVDGSGYPNGAQGSDLPELSRIVSIANMYDALVTERPFRKAFMPHEACELLTTLINRYLDPDLLDVFLSYIAIYPVGSVVRINTGEIGIVRNVLPNQATKPQLDMITDSRGILLETPHPLDLALSPKLFINRLLLEEDMLTLLTPPSSK